MSDEDGAEADEISMEEVGTDMATAFGLFALSNASLHEAASAAGVTRWELENEIERAGLADTFDVNTDSDVSDTIDDLLDEHSE
jgi:hypothetical protein